MFSNDNHSKAAAIAAEFSVMLLDAFHSEDINPVGAALSTGLFENRSNGSAESLISEFEGGKITPNQMAAKNPEACVRLAEMFAEALHTGAKRYQTDIVNCVSDAITPYKSREISDDFARLHAPVLAKLFAPLRPH